jgi:hypothetical protein
MKTFRISLLVFILSATILAQQNNFLRSERTQLIQILAQSKNDSAQKPRQHLNQIINKLNSTHFVNEYYLIDSLIAESVSGGKVKNLFEYNTEGSMIERIEFVKYTNSNWQMTDKDEYFYDIHLNLIREIFFSWNSITWDSVIQNLYEYNQDSNLISTTIQWYVTSNWENSSRETYTYDQAGNEITSLSELWENNQWTNFSMVYNYYSPENRRDSLLLQKWDRTNWQNYWRTSFYYDSLTTFLRLIAAQLWTGNQFEDYLKVNLINDELGNQIQQLEQIWNGSNWVNDIKKDYTYIWNYFESCNAELWNGTNWEPGDTPILVNNPDGFKIAIVSQSINIYYIIVNVESTISNTLNDYSLSQNYPNPFNPSTTIRYEIPQQSFVTLKVYDILGNEIATLVNEEKPAGSYEIEFNTGSHSGLSGIRELTSGIYFYTLSAGNYFTTKKMILLK